MTLYSPVIFGHTVFHFTCFEVNALDSKEQYCLPSLFSADLQAMLFGLTLKTSERDVEIRKGLKSIEIVLLNGFTTNHARIQNYLERGKKNDSKKIYSSNCVLIVLKSKRPKACEVVSFIS